MTAAPVRLGLAGFGRLAREYYLPALSGIGSARLVAVADPLPQSREEARRRIPSTAIYGDPKEMLDASRLDGLLVASLPSTHLDIWNDAARRGLPVFVEKPFVLVDQLPRVAPPAGSARLMVDFNRRFWPVYRRAGDLARDGALGAPVRIEYRLHVDVISWSTVTRHRLSEEEGGILHDLGGHAIDLAADLLGREPDTVRAELTTARRPGDRLRLDLAFTDGSSAACDLGYGDRTSEQLLIRGTSRTLTLADPNMSIHLAGNRSGPTLADRCQDLAVYAYRAVRRSHSMARFSIRGALQAFVRSVASGEPVRPGFDEAVRNVRWLEAASRSASEGKPMARPA